MNIHECDGTHILMVKDVMICFKKTRQSQDKHFNL